jgi:hypothetical protein
MLRLFAGLQKRLQLALCFDPALLKDDGVIRAAQGGPAMRDQKAGDAP